MSILLVLGGIASLVYGTLTMLGITNNDLSKDSDPDKKLLSERSRYFLGRYYTGFKFITAGAGAIALGLIFISVIDVASTSSVLQITTDGLAEL